MTTRNTSKKKLAFVMDSMHVGGIEKALVETLGRFDYEKYDVSLYLSDWSGKFLRLLDPRVHIHHWDSDAGGLFKRHLRDLHFLDVCISIMHRSLVRMYQRDWHKSIYHSVLCYPCYTDISYDCVIAYQINAPAVVASALQKIPGAKKIAFYHGKSGCPPKDSKFWDKVYAQFDRIFCVSEAARKEFCMEYPTAGENTAVLYNVLDATRILDASHQTVSDLVSDSKYTIVTVGRLSAEKGQDMIPATARILLDEGYDIHWFLVGDGYLRQKIEELSVHYDVCDRVTLLGIRDNPYPYIRDCDIYVQPSFSEGYCTTTIEAKILHKPIVTTDAPGMREQFISGENGLIVDAMTPEALSEGIRTLLDHPELRQKFADALEKEAFDNAKELQKLYDFIEDRGK